MLSDVFPATAARPDAGNTHNSINQATSTVWARQPVDGIFRQSGNPRVVFRGEDQNRLTANYGLFEVLHGRRIAG
ncbi:uncharacterized protein METZ01_LOCUS21388 [marine metagenome]|uniref:Uncharacterized protein n=1 Tax=marine metagenome TaxID=408172 RepID=A0A381PPJ6_9ZZZZ